MCFEYIFSCDISEARELTFLGVKEKNEYVVEKFFMSTSDEFGVTKLKVQIREDIYRKNSTITYCHLAANPYTRPIL